jgi:hypothetical protein
MFDSSISSDFANALRTRQQRFARLDQLSPHWQGDDWNSLSYAEEESRAVEIERSVYAITITHSVFGNQEVI